MPNPPTFDEAQERGLLAEKGQDVHTFSNGTEGYGWMELNCDRCWFFDKDCIGALCAFEAAAQMHCVTPALATMFGWTQRTTEYGPRSGWDAPNPCSLFRARPDKNDEGDDDPKPPPPPDPAQLVLLADPTEDASVITNADLPEFATSAEPRA